MPEFLRNNKEFIILLIAAAIIRFIPLFDYQFSYDELSALSRTTYANWHDLVMYGARIDAHPILIQCFLYLIVQFVGYSEVWMKLPFILMSLGAIYYIYRFSLKWFGKLPALLSALIFSFSFVFLYYSPLARMYASGVFFSSALLFYWFNWVFDSEKKKSDFVFTVLFFVLSAFNAHMGALFAFTLAVSGLLFIERAYFKMYLGMCIIVVLLYLPHLSITMFQLKYGGIGSAQNGWLPPPGKWAFAEFIQVVLGTGYVWMAIVAFVLFSLLINKFKTERKSILLIVLFFVNYAVIYAYSVLKAPIFQYSVMLFSAPAFVVGLCSLIKFKDKWNLPTIGLLSVVLLFQSLYQKDFFTGAVLNQNEFQYSVLKEAKAKYGESNVKAVFFDTEKYFIMHYELRDGKKLNYYLAQEEELNDPEKFKNFLSDNSVSKLVLGNPSPLQLALAKEFFSHVENYCETANVSVYLLSKERASRIDENDQTMLYFSDWQSKNEYQYNYNKEKYNTETETFLVDSLNEFPLSMNATLKDVSVKSGNVILAKVTLESDTIPSNVSFNCAVKNDKDSTLYFGGPEIRGFYERGKYYDVYCELFLGSEYHSWLKQNSKVSFFLWNRGKHQLKIKNASVVTVDFRPKRWGLWL